MAEEERDRKWTLLRLRGLRKRWIVNTILPVLVLLVLLVTLVSAGVSTYYYSSMENGLMKQAEAMSNAFNDYFMNSYSEYNQMATQAVDILLNKIERGTRGYVHQILMPSLIKRGSCRMVG